jgi:hypothetical protein
MTKKQLISWCDQQVKDGNELKLVWDGGNDSGWVHFEVDDENLENKYTEVLVQYMYNHLNYGSWAGDFSANGEAIYDAKEHAFVGTDYYSETGDMAYDINTPIAIPKHLWFDQLNIHIEANYDDTPDCQAEFTLKNGFLTAEHQELEKQFNEYLEQKVTEAIAKFEEEQQLGFESIWDNVILTLADFNEESEDSKIAYIKELNFRYPESEEKDIYLDLKTIELDYED